MTKHMSQSDPGMETVFVSTRIIRAQRRAQSLRRQRTIGLLIGFATIGFSPYAINSFKGMDMPARIHHAAMYSSSLNADAPAPPMESAGLVASRACIAAAQAGLRQTMTQFHSGQKMLNARLADSEVGKSLFGGTAKAEADTSSLSRFIALDPLAMPFPAMTDCATSSKESVR